MQDGADRRILYRKPQDIITPEQVGNQLIRTGEAQKQQIERNAQQKINDIEQISQGLLKAGFASKQIQERTDMADMQSLELARQKMLIDYQDKSLAIDAMAISPKEKLQKKTELQSQLKLGFQNEKSLYTNESLLSKFLGTAEQKKQTLEKISLDQQKAEQIIQSDLQSSLQKFDLEETKAGIKNNIAQITNAGNISNANQRAKISISNINTAEKTGKITKAEADTLKLQTLQELDNHAVNIAINEGMRMATSGDILGGVNYVATAYNDIQKGKRFSNVSDKPKEETKLRNALIGLQNSTIQKISNSIPLTATYEDVLSQTKGMNNEERQKLLSMQAKLQEPNNGDARFNYYEDQIKNGNPAFAGFKNTIAERRNYQNQIGKENFTALTNAEAKLFESQHNQIGLNNIKIVDGKPVKTSDFESYGDFLNNYVKELGGIDNAIIESNIHNLDYGTRFILENIKSGKELKEFEPIINIIAGKNRNEIKEPDKKEIKIFQEQAKTSNEYKFLESTGRMKEAKDLIEGQANYRAMLKDKNYFNNFKQDNIYIVNNNMQLKIPNQDGNAELKKTGIQAILNTPQTSLGLKGNDLIDNDIIVETAGDKAFFYKKNKYTNNRDVIGQFNLDDLIFTKEQIKQMQESEYKIESERKDKKAYSEAIKNEIYNRQKNKQTQNAINQQKQEFKNMSFADKILTSAKVVNRFNQSTADENENLSILDKIRNSLQRPASENKSEIKNLTGEELQQSQFNI